MTHFIKFSVLSLALAAASARAVVYCKSVGVPKGCVARPVGVGAPAIGIGAQRNLFARTALALAVGVACWATGADGRSQRAVLRAMLVYSAGACAVLALSGSQHLAGWSLLPRGHDTFRADRLVYEVFQRCRPAWLRVK